MGSTSIQFSEFRTKKILITGASTGIGAELAKAFAKQGAILGLHYFSSEDYESAFTTLLNNYSKDKERVKKKLVELFEALGNDHIATKTYRKKLSSLMFS